MARTQAAPLRCRGKLREGTAPIAIDAPLLPSLSWPTLLRITQRHVARHRQPAPPVGAGYLPSIAIDECPRARRSLPSYQNAQIDGHDFGPLNRCEATGAEWLGDAVQPVAQFHSVDTFDDGLRPLAAVTDAIKLRLATPSRSRHVEPVDDHRVPPVASNALSQAIGRLAGRPAPRRYRVVGIADDHRVGIGAIRGPTFAAHLIGRFADSRPCGLATNDTGHDTGTKDRQILRRITCHLNLLPDEQ